MGSGSFLNRAPFVFCKPCPCNVRARDYHPSKRTGAARYQPPDQQKVRSGRGDCWSPRQPHWRI